MRDDWDDFSPGPGQPSGVPWVIKLYALTTFVLVISAYAEAFADRWATGSALAVLALLVLALTLVMVARWQAGRW